MMKNYYLKDYDRFLDYCCGLFNKGEKILTENRIDESMGIVDEYDDIAEELYQALINTEPIPFNNKYSYLRYTLRNYKMNQDCFLDTLTISVNTRNEDDSNFNMGNVDLLKDNLKLQNAFFNINIEEKFLNTQSGKNEFMQLMAHELQHAYRFYCILLTNQSYLDQEIKKKTRYGNSIPKGNEGNIRKKLMHLYYCSEKDEISSETNKLYEFIKQHEEINSRTFQAQEENFPLYTIIGTLEEGLSMIDAHIKDTELMDYIGKVYKEIIMDENNMTNQKGAMKFRTRMINALMMAKRNFKRTLAKAFQDFDRYVVDENQKKLKKIMKWNDSDLKEIMEEMKDFKLLNEILKNNES